MEKVYSEMLVTHSLVWIDVLKEIVLNCEIVNALLPILLNIMHEIVIIVTIKVLCVCVIKLNFKFQIKYCLII